MGVCAHVCEHVCMCVHICACLWVYKFLFLQEKVFLCSLGWSQNLNRSFCFSLLSACVIGWSRTTQLSKYSKLTCGSLSGHVLSQIYELFQYCVSKNVMLITQVVLACGVFSFTRMGFENSVSKKGGLKLYHSSNVEVLNSFLNYFRGICLLSLIHLFVVWFI